MEKKKSKHREKRTNYLVIAVLGILLLLSAVQAVQINNLKEGISSGKIRTGTAPTSAPAVAPVAAAPPAMVGGC